MATAYFPPIVTGYPGNFNPDAIVAATGWGDPADGDVRTGIQGVSEALHTVNTAVAQKAAASTQGLAQANEMLAQIFALINWIGILREHVAAAGLAPEIARQYIEWLDVLRQELGTVAGDIATVPDAATDPQLTQTITNIKAQLLATAQELERGQRIDSATPQSRTDAAARFDTEAGGGSENADAAAAVQGAFTGGRRIRRRKRGGYTYGRSPRRSTRRSTPRKTKKDTPTRTRSHRRGKRRGRKRTKGRSSTHSRR